MTSHWIACLIVIITEIKPIILIWFCVILANLFGSAISFSSFMLLKIEDGQGELIIFLDTYRKFILCTQYFEWGCEMPLSKFGILSVSPVELCIHLSLFCPSLEWGHKSRHRQRAIGRERERGSVTLTMSVWSTDQSYQLLWAGLRSHLLSCMSHNLLWQVCQPQPGKDGQI